MMQWWAANGAPENEMRSVCGRLGRLALAVQHVNSDPVSTSTRLCCASPVPTCTSRRSTDTLYCASDIPASACCLGCAPCEGGWVPQQAETPANGISPAIICRLLEFPLYVLYFARSRLVLASTGLPAEPGEYRTKRLVGKIAKYKGRSKIRRETAAPVRQQRQ